MLEIIILISVVVILFCIFIILRIERKYKRLLKETNIVGHLMVAKNGDIIDSMFLEFEKMPEKFHQSQKVCLTVCIRDLNNSSAE